MGCRMVWEEVDFLVLRKAATGLALQEGNYIQERLCSSRFHCLLWGVSQREPRVCLKVLNDINGEVRLGKQGVVLHQIHGCPSSHWVCGKLGPITSGVHYVPIGE